MTGSLRHAPAGEPSVARTIRTVVRSSARRRIGRRLPRRPAVRHVAAARARRGRRLPRRATRARAARAGVSRARPRGRGSPQRRAPVKAAILDQRTRRRRREHLRRRGALARAHPPAARGAEPRRRARCRRSTAAIRRALELGIARQGSTLRDYALPDGSPGAMQHEFKVYGRAGEPCDALRHADREDPRRRPRHVVLPVVPARPRRARGGSLGREQLVELAVAVEARGARCSRRSAGRRSRSAGRVQPPVSSSSLARNPGSSSTRTSVVRRVPCGRGDALARTQ